MPCYHIDTDDGVTHVRDNEGREFASIIDARNLAHRALAEMACQNLPDGEQHTFTASIRDEIGTKLYRATMTLQGEWELPTATQGLTP